MICHARSGFTLVELLIVISIIGVLASVILSSLNDAREEGVEAKIQSEMDSIAKRAAIEESQTFTYDTVCGSGGMATSTTIDALIDSINSLASSTVTCNSTSISYAVSVPLGSAHWCVDSVGNKGAVPTPLGPSQYQCP